MTLAFVHELGFRTGFAAGAAASGAAWVAWLCWRRIGHRSQLPIAGMAFAVAAVVGLDRRVQLANGVIPGVLLLAAAGWLTADLQLPEVLKVVAATPGAVALAYDGGLPGTPWIRLLVVAVTLIGAWSVSDFDRRWSSRGYTPVLWAITIVGVYYTVPDTTEALVVLGAALPVIVLGWPKAVASFGPAGSWASVGLLAWTVGFEGQFRQSAMIGGMACLGLLVIEPLINRLFRGDRNPLDLLPPSYLGTVGLAGIHLGLVYVASRVAGLRGHTGPKGLLVGGLAQSVLIVAVEFTVVIGLGLVIGRQPGWSRLRRGSTRARR